MSSPSVLRHGVRAPSSRRPSAGCQSWFANHFLFLLDPLGWGRRRPGSLPAALSPGRAAPILLLHSGSLQRPSVPAMAIWWGCYRSLSLALHYPLGSVRLLLAVSLTVTELLLDVLARLDEEGGMAYRISRRRKGAG